MTFASAPGDAHSAHHGRLARWAVGLSALFGVAIVVVAGGLALGGETVWDRGWGLPFGVVTTVVGVAAALAAFVTAIASVVKGERWSLLLAPLSAFPALVVFLVVGEAFIWE